MGAEDIYIELSLEKPLIHRLLEFALFVLIVEWQSNKLIRSKIDL